MTTGLLTKEQVTELNYKECKAALKLLFKTYHMETPIAELSKEEWDLCDDIGNTLLWLEDRIKQFEDPRIPSMDPGAVIVKPPVEKVKKTGPVARRYRIGDTVYENIHVAALKTGVKVNTLRNYVGRNPDRYEYVD
jgi:hypothetical protein